jgi:hypothetical protein
VSNSFGVAADFVANASIQIPEPAVPFSYRQPFPEF